MTKLKQCKGGDSSYGDVELDQYISENCHHCKEELIRVEDIFVGIEDNHYYCEDCAKYNKISVVECKDI